MPTTFNQFVDSLDLFWLEVIQHYGDENSSNFKTFFNPIFYLPDHIDLSDAAHPLNQYGANGSVSDNVDRLRIYICDHYPSASGNLLRYMFEEETHPIYLALLSMLNTYMNFGNTLRNEVVSSDSD